MSTPHALLAATGFRLGDLLRLSAHTSRSTLPGPRRISRTEAMTLAPALLSTQLRGALTYWDGQLEDDARLVTCLARTAAAYGANVHTRARVLTASNVGVTVRDELTGESVDIRARTATTASNE